MRTPAPPAASGPLQRSVVACLAAILDVDVADVPLPAENHPEPWTVWSNWLGRRGLGLVPIDDPARFQWPGPWLALLDDGHAAVAYGAPPGLAWDPLDGASDFRAVRAGFAVAPTDVALWMPPGREGARLAGVVEAIAIAPAAKAPLVLVERVVARAGRGLEGDRYFEGRGTFSTRHGRGHELTLIDGDVVDELGLSATEARRNLVTRGIDLDALVGEEFVVGTVRCEGQRLCQPCAHLERLVPGTLRALAHRGGLRADVLADGEIRRGDRIGTAARHG